MGTSGTPSFDAAAARLEGVSAIPVTPFDDALRIDEVGLRRVIERLVVSGINVVVPCGNTSEYWSLERREALTVAASVIEQVDGRATVLVGVGGEYAKATAEAKAALKRGAAGVMIHSPRDPYLSSDGLTAYYTAVAQATEGAVALYIRDYDLPDAVLRHVLELPNVVAVKYAIPNVLRFGELAARHRQEALWICGLAESWAPFFWPAGACGFTSGLANLVPHLPLALVAALKANDYAGAMEIWREALPFEQLRARHGNANNVVAVKEALALLGICGARVRPPLAPLSPADRAELNQVVDRWQIGGASRSVASDGVPPLRVVQP